jgi:hypothetical protein
VEDEYCPECNACLEWVSCWECFGEGGWHDCGEDCCCCLDPEINEWCPTCGGDGEYLECPNVPHDRPRDKKRPAPGGGRGWQN